MFSNISSRRNKWYIIRIYRTSGTFAKSALTESFTRKDTMRISIRSMHTIYQVPTRKGHEGSKGANW